MNVVPAYWPGLTFPVSRLRSSGTADKVLSQLELFSGWTMHTYNDPVPS
jgi:hypothetical protein